MNIKTIDMDTLIDIFSQLSKQKNEFTEQDAAGGDSGGASSGGGGSNVPKWADTYPIKRGPANMLGKQGEKWDTGLTRGPANQIW
jgi:hypothetical protein